MAPLWMLIGLCCGFPTVVESDAERYWHAAHEALILTGTLMLAVSAVMSHLVLAKREAAGLFWALVATGYGLAIGTVLQGILPPRWSSWGRALPSTLHRRTDPLTRSAR